MLRNELRTGFSVLKKNYTCFPIQLPVSPPGYQPAIDLGENYRLMFRYYYSSVLSVLVIIKQNQNIREDIGSGNDAISSV